MVRAKRSTRSGRSDRDGDGLDDLALRIAIEGAGVPADAVPRVAAISPDPNHRRRASSGACLLSTSSLPWQWQPWRLGRLDQISTTGSKSRSCFRCSPR